MKKVLSLILVFAVIIALAACGTASTPAASSNPSAGAPAASSSSALSSPGKPVEITVAFASLPNGLDPLSEDATSNMSISNDVYDHLMWRGADNSMTPAVAKSLNKVDGVTWQFEINLDYVFQNGDKLTMDDVVFSIMRLKDIPKTADIGKLIDNVSYTGTTLTVKVVKEDNSIIPKIIDKTLIVNKAYIAKNGDDAIYKNPIGTGPYKVTEFTPGTTVVLETWSGYPFAQPQISKVTYIGIPENANRYIAVETGKAQYAALVSSLEMNLAEKNDKLSTLTTDSSSNQCFVFQCEKPPFDNVNVRRALAYAFDRDSFAALNGGRPPVVSLLFGGYKDLYVVGDAMPTFDLEKAKQMLAAEGYTASNPLAFELLYWTPDPGLELYQSTLKSIGVEMTLKQVEFSVYLSREGAGDFDVAWTSQTNRNGNALTDLDRFDYNLVGSRDISRYKNDQVQDLIGKMRVASDQDLKSLSVQINQILAQDVPAFGGFLRPLFCVMDKNLSGVVLRGDMQHCFRYATYTA